MIEIPIRVLRGEKAVLYHARRGESLREFLLRHALSPYRGRFRQLNCRGMGICGSCQVKVVERGARWSRRSCQIRCFQEMEIELE